MDCLLRSKVKLLEQRVLFSHLYNQMSVWLAHSSWSFRSDNARDIAFTADLPYGCHPEVKFPILIQIFFHEAAIQTVIIPLPRFFHLLFHCMQASRCYHCRCSCGQRSHRLRSPLFGREVGVLGLEVKLWSLGSRLLGERATSHSNFWKIKRIWLYIKKKRER